MAELFIRIPDEFKRQAEESNLEISEIIVQFIKHKSKSKDLKRLKQIVAKSQFTEKDAQELSNKVNNSMHEDLVKRGLL
jgi:hypothetical protein